MVSEKKRKREDSNINLQAAGRAGRTAVGLVDGLIGVESSPKQPKVNVNDSPNPHPPSPSPSPSSIVTSLVGGSPSVDSKLSSHKHEVAIIDAVKRPLPFSIDGESRIMERLKDLCSVKEATVKVGIEMVGAAYLLDHIMTPNCSHTKTALQDAVKAANEMIRAEKLFSDSQKNLKEVIDKLESYFG